VVWTKRCRRAGFAERPAREHRTRYTTGIKARMAGSLADVNPPPGFIVFSSAFPGAASSETDGHGLEVPS
jgi:hypothetical protein